MTSSVISPAGHELERTARAAPAKLSLSRASKLTLSTLLCALPVARSTAGPFSREAVLTPAGPVSRGAVPTSSDCATWMHDTTTACHLHRNCTRIPFFVHVSKAGGSTVCRMARKAGLRVPPVSPPWANCNSKAVTETWMREKPRLHECKTNFCSLAHRTLLLENVNFLAWELPGISPPFEAQLMLCPRLFRYGIVLREPLARIASSVRYTREVLKRITPWPVESLESLRVENRTIPWTANLAWRQNGAARNYTLSKVEVADLDNVYVRALTGTTRGPHWVPLGQLGEGMLERAKHVLESFELVVTLEDLASPKTLQDMHEVFHFEEHVTPPHANAQTHDAQDSLAPLTPPAVEHLRRLNTLDLALYDHVQARPTPTRRRRRGHRRGRS